MAMVLIGFVGLLAAGFLWGRHRSIARMLRALSLAFLAITAISLILGLNPGTVSWRH